VPSAQESSITLLFHWLSSCYILTSLPVEERLDSAVLAHAKSKSGFLTPICWVTPHYGEKFSYPLQKRQLAAINVDKKQRAELT